MFKPSDRIPALVLVAGFALTCAAYWVGLHGPFLLDDPFNLAVVQRWTRGTGSLAEVLFGNGGPATWRALAMASFAINADLLGFTPFAFKLGNLFLHLLCGAVAFAWLARMLASDPQHAAARRWVAAAIVIVWLLHPLNVSTVLYTVQRMTQVAALGVLTGLWLYVAMRQRIERGEHVSAAWTALFVGIPLLTFLGVQGKQNAIILPALCTVVELAYFRGPRRWNAPIGAFHALYVFLPGLAGSAMLAWKWNVVMRGYAEYQFGPYERLITLPRILWDYIRMILAPSPPRMGVYTDDVLASTGLFSPVTTGLGWLALALVSAAAWRVRNKAPGALLGWAVFLIGHSVEGTVLPLDLYFEHRNYLPAFGLLLMVGSFIALAAARLRLADVRVGRIGVVAATALVAMLAVQTHGRARVWSDPLVLNQTALRAHPDSLRAVVNNMGMFASAGAAEAAYAVADEAMQPARRHTTRVTAQFARVVVDCMVQHQTSPTDLDKAAEALPDFIDLTTFQLFSRLVGQVAPQARCRGLRETDIARAAAVAADGATAQADGSWPKWRLRYLAASLYARNNEWDLALPQAQLSWQDSTNGERAWVLVQALVRAGKLAEAKTIYLQAVSRLDPNDPQAKQHRATLDRMLSGPVAIDSSHFGQ